MLRFASQRASSSLVAARHATLRNYAALATAHVDEKNVQEWIEKTVKEHKIVLFMKGSLDSPMCGFSRAVGQLLTMYGVPPNDIQTVNVLDNQDIREGAKEYSEWPTFPQLYTNGELVGGADVIIEMQKTDKLPAFVESLGYTPDAEQK